MGVLNHKRGGDCDSLHDYGDCHLDDGHGECQSLHAGMDRLFVEVHQDQSKLHEQAADSLVGWYAIEDLQLLIDWLDSGNREDRFLAEDIYQAFSVQIQVNTDSLSEKHLHVSFPVLFLLLLRVSPSPGFFSWLNFSCAPIPPIASGA